MPAAPLITLLIPIRVTYLKMFPSKVLSKLDLITYNLQRDVESLIGFIFSADSPCQDWKHTYTSLNRHTQPWQVFHL